MNDRTEGLSLNFSTNSIRSLRDIEDFVRENNPQIPKHENLTNFRQERTLVISAEAIHCGKRMLYCAFQNLGISASTVVRTPVLGWSNVSFWACSAIVIMSSDFSGSRLPYMRSPTIGHPREASWTRN